MKVVIFGSPRSGTTALFYVIKAAMPPKTRLLFEPVDDTPVPADESVLAKVLATCPEDGSAGRRMTDYGRFFGFDRKVVLTRDPRDWLVSGLLFLPQQHALVHGRRYALGQVLATVRRKERDPRAVPVTELLATAVEAAPDGAIERTMRWLVEQLRWITDFEHTVPGRLPLRYEDLVDGHLAALEAYLGLPLTPDPTVPAPHDHVTRSKRHGQWRHWFTPEDVASFRPLMEPYLRQYGYSTDWTLAPDPVIRPEEASEYVVRSVRLGRRRRSLPRRILVRLAGGGQ